MNNWEKLCKQINPLISKRVNEDILHSQFESCLQTIFNWDDANIKHKPPVKIGREKKQADIVLTGNDFGIVIEIKHPGIELDDEAKGQLFSYIRILKYKYGFLIGNEIVIFFDDDNNGEQPSEVARFDFDAKNVDGISLCDILHKEACSNEKLKEFMLTRIKSKQENEKNERLKKELLSNNGAKIKEILKEKLLLGGYKEEVIINIIRDITIYPKNNIIGSGDRPVPPPPIPPDNTSNDPVWEKIKKLKKQRNMSWIQLAEGCNTLLSKIPESDCRPNAKSFANVVIKETGLETKEILELLKKRGVYRETT
jgi:hypothetical protein